MLLTLEKIVDRVLDLALRLVPGSRYNPKSLESRVRRNWGTYDRARDRATRLLTDAARHQEAIEAEVSQNAAKAAKAARDASSALLARARQLDELTRRDDHR